MRQAKIAIGLLSMIFVVCAWNAFAPAQTEAKKAIDAVLPLEALFTGQLQIIDLGYSLNDKNAYWPAANYEPFRLKTIATLEKDGVLSKAFSMPEHLGTHLDAPNHFEKGQKGVDEIEARNLFVPGVVVDISAKVESQEDYQFSIADIEQWEQVHGRIPERAVILLHTGWGSRWKNFAAYKNQDVMGRLHFPGYSAESAKLLVNDRKVSGIGIDTLSMDSGLSKDFAVHHIVNAAGKYGLENVAHLDQLPARGFYLVIAPIKIEAGSGGPTRIFAVLPK